MVKAATDHRERLITGLIQVLADKPYREVTLTDIAAAARVSRRSFYQHFANKDECLLALAQETSTEILRVMIASVSAATCWNEVVENVTDAYLGFIIRRPAVMRALYIETPAVGIEGLKMRRTVSTVMATFLQQQVSHYKARGEIISDIDQPSALALIAGVNELILHYFMDEKVSQLMELAPATGYLIQRYMSAPSD